jgi:hypothetical protein
MLETVTNFFKENWIKTVSTTMVSLVALFGAIWGITEHFATAADLNRVEGKQEIYQKSSDLNTQILLNKQTLRGLKNQVADIEDKPTKTSSENVKKNRLNRDIVEIEKENAILIQQKFTIENTKK